MMIRFLKITVLIIFISAPLIINSQRPQRVGFIDIEYILDNIDSYQNSLSSLDEKVAVWNSEIKLYNEEIEKLKEDLGNRKSLLTKEIIAEKESYIEYLGKNLDNLKQKRFGPEGDIFQQQHLLIKPIQDKIFIIANEIGKNRRYDYIFDKSSEALLLFANNRNDISNLVLKRMKSDELKTKLKDRLKSKSGQDPITKGVEDAKKIIKPKN